MMSRKNRRQLAVAESALRKIEKALIEIPGSKLTDDFIADRILDMDTAIGAWRRGIES